MRRQRGDSKSKEIYRELIRLTTYMVMLGYLVSCQPKILVATDYSELNFPIKSDSLPLDTKMDSFIMPYRTGLEMKMNEVLAVSEIELTKEQPEGLLGDFICDILYKASEKKHWGINMVFLNHGGLRNNLPRGSITVGNVYELMPFDNEVVIMKVYGSTIKKVAQRSATKGGDPVSGITMEFNQSQPVNIKIGGVPLDSAKIYQVLTSDYLANGGDQLDCLSEKISVENTHIKLRDFIINEMRELGITGKPIRVSKDGRVKNGS